MSTPIKIVEGVESTWFYHLSMSGDNYQPALCGKTSVMTTSLPLKSWGIVSHLHERYCPDCESAAKHRGIL